MKRIISILFIALLLTGCKSTEYQNKLNCIEIQLSEDIQNPIDEIDNAYYYVCPQKEEYLEEKYEFDDITEQNVNFRVLDATYDLKDYEELLYYMEEYVNNLFELDVIRDKEKCYVTSCEFIYLRRCYNNEYYLLPVLEFAIRNYGYLYIEVNSGCIIW